MTPNEHLMPLLNLSPAEKFDIAFKLAEHIGHVIIKESEHNRLQSALSNCHQEIFKLRDELLHYATPAHSSQDRA